MIYHAEYSIATPFHVIVGAYTAEHRWQSQIGPSFMTKIPVNLTAIYGRRLNDNGLSSKCFAIYGRPLDLVKEKGLLWFGFVKTKYKRATITTWLWVWCRQKVIGLKWRWRRFVA